MSDRTSLSVYLDGTLIDVTIFPYCVDYDDRFIYEIIQTASLLDGCTDVREIRKRCHMARGNTQEEAEAYAASKEQEEQDDEEGWSDECIADSHYIIDLSARCIYRADYGAEFGHLSIPLEELKYRSEIDDYWNPFMDEHVLWFDSVDLDEHVLWFDSVDLDVVLKKLAEPTESVSQDSLWDELSLSSYEGDGLSPFSSEEELRPAPDEDDEWFYWN